ncbi:MAG: VanZ family protein [Deltaproteobacteria bacterium]|nr:VanZ family protein [Deltaproteobacteria bacterium]
MSFPILKKFDFQWLRNRAITFYGAVFAVICVVMLGTGLWPFDFRPSNNVMWLGDRNGINFYGYGMVISADSWNKEQNSLFPDRSISMEIWLRPLTETSSLPSILTLYDERTPYVFFVGQWRAHLAIRSRTDDLAARKPGKSYQEVGLSNGLLKDVDTFITITSGPEGTAIYQNGMRAKIYPRHRLLSGYKGEPVRLILGNAHSSGSYWTGHISGLAVYNRTLKPQQVAHNYQEWIHKGCPSEPNDGRIALYVFDERKGSIVHNRESSDKQLTIPEIFTPVKMTVLSTPWRHDDFQWNRSYFQDVTINIVGFIPFGFFCAGLLIKARGFRMSAMYMITILVGFVFSLAIELLQVYLPTRDSSLLDLICNVVGTLLGVIVFHTILSASHVSQREY